MTVPVSVGLIQRKAVRHNEWARGIVDEGVCSPMEMILDLKPEQDLNEGQGSVIALVTVKKCRLLSLPKNTNGENVTCVAVKKRTRLIPILVGYSLRFN